MQSLHITGPSGCTMSCHIQEKAGNKCMPTENSMLGSFDTCVALPLGDCKQQPGCQPAADCGGDVHCSGGSACTLQLSPQNHTNLIHPMILDGSAYRSRPQTLRPIYFLSSGIQRLLQCNIFPMTDQGCERMYGCFRWFWTGV